MCGSECKEHNTDLNATLRKTGRHTAAQSALQYSCFIQSYACHTAAISKFVQGIPSLSDTALNSTLQQNASETARRESANPFCMHAQRVHIAGIKKGSLHIKTLADAFPPGRAATFVLFLFSAETGQQKQSPQHGKLPSKL